MEISSSFLKPKPKLHIKSKRLCLDLEFSWLEWRWTSRLLDECMTNAIMWGARWEPRITSKRKVLVEYEAKMFRLGGAVRTFLSQLNGKKLFRVGHKRAYEALVTYLFESAVKMLQFFLGQLSATNEWLKILVRPLGSLVRKLPIVRHTFIIRRCNHYYYFATIITITFQQNIIQHLPPFSQPTL